MCEYCEQGYIENENIIDENIPLITDSGLDVSMAIDDEQNFRLLVGITVGNTSGEVAVFKNRIKFCPMCGRKLSEVSE